jgi:hypothetical protein
MRTIAQPVILLGPLVIFSLFAYAFDTVLFPNELLNQLGWVWAIFSALCRFISHPVVVRNADSPGGLPHPDAAGSRGRRTDVFAVPSGTLPAEAAISGEESHDASVRLKLLAAKGFAAR